MKTTPSWLRQLAVLSGLFAASLAEAATPPGTVVAWGNNLFNQTNVPPDLTNIVAMAAGGYHSLAVKSNGLVAAFGYNGDGEATVPPGLSNVVSVAGGGWHSLALQSGGKVVAWGSNNYGQTNVPTALNNAVAIAGGYYHSLALQSDGKVVGWGYNADGETTLPAPLSNGVATAISAGYDHNLALKADGTVVAWGANYDGEGSVPAGLSNVTAIAAGGYHNLALRSNGTVVAWGNNTYGQATVPPGLSNVMAIAAGGYHNLALQSNGLVVAWGSSADGEGSALTGLSNVVAIAAGGSHSLAIALAPVILVPPPPAIALVQAAGTNLNVGVWPGAPFTCQWSLNGVPLAGATGTNLVITNFNLAKAGAYTVAVTNRYGYGIATSAVRLTNSPVILLDGADVGGGVARRYVSTQVTMSSTFGANAPIYYTLDGSQPDFTSLPYSGAFTLTNNVTLRAIAYNSALAVWAEAAPISVQIWTTLPLSVTTSGAGSVSISPAPYAAGNLYVNDTLVTLTATPSNGWAFAGWTGDSTATTNVTTVLMDRPRAVQAVFLLTPTYPLLTSTPGGGSVSVTPAPFAAQNFYLSNTLVTLTATPSSGWSFVRWAGDSTDTTNVTTVLMDRPRTVQALFGTSLNLFTNGNGQVLLNPPTGPYLYGSTVQLTAVPSPGHYFFGWSGAVSGFANPLLLTATDASGITALFGTLKTNQVLLTVLPGSNGTVTIDPLKNVYTNGEIVTLTAMPAPGYFLAGWGGDSSGDLNPLPLVLDANKLVTASFASESNRPPTFQSVVRAGDTLTFAWSTVPGRAYQVEYKTNLDDTTWTSLSGPITATNSTTTASDPVAADALQRWYRVALLP
jgi:uncharacterized repeat protein (TIGR02543 family)